MPALIERTATGKKPDWGDIMFNVDQKSTPFFNAVPKGSKPENTLFQWNVDAYAPPTTAGVPDNADVSNYEDPGAYRGTLYGRIQRSWRPWKVSKLAQEVMHVAGVGQKQEVAKAIVKKMKELKRDVELTLLSDNDSAEDDGVNGYKTRGIGKWAQSTAQTDQPVPTAFLTPSTSITTTNIADITNQTFTTIFKSMYDKVGTASDLRLFAGSTLRTKCSELTFYDKVPSNLTLVRQFKNDAADNSIELMVDVIKGDLGTATIFDSSFINASGDATSAASMRLGYLIPMDMVELRVAQAPQNQEIPDAGGGQRGVIDVIYGLCVRNPLSLGKLAPAA